MEDFERKLRRAAVKRRSSDTRKVPEGRASKDPAQKRERAATRRKKLDSLGIKTEVCPVCGCDDVSTFEFDHVAGRKHHDQEWPLCETCHQEKNSMLPEQPMPSDNPRNVFDVIGHWLLGMAEYFEMMIRHLRKFGEFLIELASRGYGAELEFPT